MFDDREGEQPGQVEEEGSDNDNKSNEAEDENDERQNEEDEKNEKDDRKKEEEEEEEENADKEEKKTKLLANYSEKLQKALMGDLNSDFPDNVKIVRIFTSSTFTGKYIT